MDVVSDTQVCDAALGGNEENYALGEECAVSCAEDGSRGGSCIRPFGEESRTEGMVDAAGSGWTDEAYMR